MMRRARLQIKPNLGPRSGTQTQSSADTAAIPKVSIALVPSQPPQLTTAVIRDTGKINNFTHLKPSEGKADSDYVGDISAGQSLSDNIIIPDKVFTPSSKFTSKSSGPEQLKVSSKNDLSESWDSGHSRSTKTPFQTTSPSLCPNQDLTESATLDSTPIVDSFESETANENISTTYTPCASPGKKGTASVTKSVPGRGTRSRFARVQPNLVIASRRVKKPLLAAEKAISEAETSLPKKDTDIAEISFHGKDDSVLASSGTEFSHDSEKMAEDVDQSEASLFEQSPAAGRTVTTTVDSDDTDYTDVGESSQTDVNAAEVPKEKLTEERKITSEKKKAKRMRPTLPSAESPADRGKMKMSDLIYWNPPRNHMKKKEVKTPASESGSNSVDVPDSASTEACSDQLSDSGDTLPVPQLKIGPDGNIVLNMDSLVMDSQGTDPLGAEMETIEEDDDRFITCSSFREGKKHKRWMQSETDRFYRALSLVGTDFSLMCKLFPNRSRRELKNKFSKEEKRNRPLIDKALRERQSLDRLTFEKAREEGANEQDRLGVTDVTEKGKRKKAKTDVKKWDEDDETYDVENEEEIEQKIYEEEQEERKENSRKRSRRKLTADQSKFPAYRRTKPDCHASGHAEEVVEILVNMSQGKMAAGKNGLDDDFDDTASVVSVEENREGSVFVPPVARLRPTARRCRTTSSSQNVIVDYEVSLPQTEMQTVSISSEEQTLFTAPELPLPAQVTTAAGQKMDGSWIPNYSAATAELNNSLVMDSTVGQVPNVVCSSGQMQDIETLIESLQAQTSTPVDVMLVEHRSESEPHGVVHVYLVPRSSTQFPGSELNGTASEGGDGNSVQRDNTIVTNENTVREEVIETFLGEGAAL